MAIEPGAVATRPDDEPDGSPLAEPVFKPRDFRLNLQARLAEPAEPLTDLDSPAIRKLTWEHVVPDRPASSAPSAATIVPLPPPRRVVPPAPPRPAKPLEPPAGDRRRRCPTSRLAPQTMYRMRSSLTRSLQLSTTISPTKISTPTRLPTSDRRRARRRRRYRCATGRRRRGRCCGRTVEPRPEVNRLALVPDLIDDDSPIELPAITPSGPIVAHAQSVYRPVLAETFYVPPPARPPTTTVAAMVADSKSSRRRAPGKPKRHLFRSFVTLVVLFGLLAGGAFAAKKYLLQPAEVDTRGQATGRRGRRRSRAAVQGRRRGQPAVGRRLRQTTGRVDRRSAGRPCTGLACVGTAQR